MRLDLDLGKTPSVALNTREQIIQFKPVGSGTQGQMVMVNKLLTYIVTDTLLYTE